MFKYKPKSSVEVKGAMSEEGADYAGKLLAKAAVIAAAGIAIAGMASLLWAIRWW
ncbi:hypothetical protein [Lysobacter sp. GCM10012299]|uniref:hypothetical protein n=1 Tax=Lysobacter sp. GCM10012299 TaxID=3317333 RepID=UPI0036241160